MQKHTLFPKVAVDPSVAKVKKNRTRQWRNHVMSRGFPKPYHKRLRRIGIGGIVKVITCSPHVEHARGQTQGHGLFPK